MEHLADKVAVVTGAGSGIGAGIARAAHAAGMRVVLADIDIDKARDVANELGERTLAVQVDVSDLSSVEALRDAAVAEFGTVHLLCNNAGVWIGALMQEADIKDWEYLINVNLYGVIHGLQAFLPMLVAQGEGHIVNTASIGGLISGPPEGLYSATKFAVVGLSESLLMELADSGVGVSVLCPGLVNTNLISQSFAVRPQSMDSGIKHEQPAPDTSVGVDPTMIGQQVIDAVADNNFYIITHDDYRDFLVMRHDGILAALDAHRERYGSTAGTIS